MKNVQVQESIQERFKRFLKHSAKDFVEVLPYLKRLGKYVKPYRFRWIVGLILGAIAGAW